jgi:hypothetical protein
MHKQTIILLSLLLSGLQSFSQERLIGESNGKPGIEIGYLHLYNNLNADNYFRFRYTFATNNGDASIGGFSLNLNIPTKLKYIDLSVGSVFMKGFDEIDFGNIYPVSVNAHDYIINGGGVYFGISPKLKGKFISLTSMFGAGFFSFKEYVSIVNNIYDPFADEHDLKASYGPVAISSVGLGIRIWKLGINPSVVAIYSGGAGASFTFYGFNLPITLQF